MQVLTIDLGTELGPAISLAYERAESDIMERPPRDPKKDRLVSSNLLIYSYITSGFIISAGCMAAYVWMYNANDIMLSDFFAPDINKDKGGFFSITASEAVFVERTGKTWTPDEQKLLFTKGTSAWYIALTVGQFFHIWVCKTRISSIFTHGFANKSTIYGVAAGLVLAIFFVYVPGVQSIVGSYFVDYSPWILALANGIVLWIYNEGSKYYFRRADPESRIVRLFAW